MAKKVLLINDLAGYGKVALSAMLPVLSYLKYETYNLPTAIVSKYFGLRKIRYSGYHTVYEEHFGCMESCTTVCRKKR